jgi:hypothetical protein
MTEWREAEIAEAKTFMSSGHPAVVAVRALPMYQASILGVPASAREYHAASIIRAVLAATARPGEQPMPNVAPEGAVGAHDLVLADLKLELGPDWEHTSAAAWLLARKQVGLDTYGTVLAPVNGRDCARDLIEEVTDAVVYARNWMAEGAEVGPAYKALLNVFLRLSTEVGPPW